MKDKLLLSAALILCNYQSYSLDHQSRYLQEEGLEASNSTQATEVEQDTPAEEQPVDEQEEAESTEAPEDEQEAVEEEGTDADFPVETDEEREDRLARERVEDDEAVQRDYQSVYD
jgi:outer membrane biosynthesis protein TonB